MFNISTKSQKIIDSSTSFVKICFIFLKISPKMSIARKKWKQIKIQNFVKYSLVADYLRWWWWWLDPLCPVHCNLIMVWRHQHRTWRWDKLSGKSGTRILVHIQHQTASQPGCESRWKSSPSSSPPGRWEPTGNKITVQHTSTVLLTVIITARSFNIRQFNLNVQKKLKLDPKRVHGRICGYPKSLIGW